MELRENSTESRFDGGILGLFVTRIITFLMVFLTFGIAGPWATVFYQKWVTRHTIINGRRLTFTGNGLQLFGNYIIWLILTIITLGIYSLWLSLNMKKWITKHTHFEGDYILDPNDY